MYRYRVDNVFNFFYTIMYIWKPVCSPRKVLLVDVYLCL